MGQYRKNYAPRFYQNRYWRKYTQPKKILLVNANDNIFYHMCIFGLTFVGYKMNCIIYGSTDI